jgi:PAS domain S-box-containing protein
MTEDETESRPEFARLRRRAEAYSRRRLVDAEDLSQLTLDEIRRLIHEMDVQRIELEMQFDELRRTQAALEAARDRYSALFDMAPLGYLSLDSQGRIRQANFACAELLGMERQHLTNKKLNEFIVSGNQDHFFNFLRQSFRDPARKRCELEVQRADGSRFHAHVEGLSGQADNGLDHECLAVIMDITKRKRAEEALREADRRKNEFLATLAHELRNPLAPIRNAVEILKQQGPREVSVQAAQDMIERQLRHMVRLIDDLMDVGRITRGKLQLRPERIELATVLEQALEASSPHVECRELTLAVSLPPERVYLDGDPVRLVQVFQNLLNNACMYTQKGGSIRVNAEQDGANVVVRIMDTGVGIAPDDLPNLFQMFAQVSTPPDQPATGLGIGLALARGLVELHGGGIEARSEGLGKGSEFRVRLPVCAAMHVPPPAPAQQRADPEAFTCRRVLVADDNPDNAESLAMLLRLTGHEVETALDGIQTIEVAERFRPEVVLLDIGMPRLNGYEACRHIRAQPWGEAISIVALTGRGQAEDHRKSREAGFNRHLVKPVQPTEILDLVASAPRPDGS